MTIDEIRKQMVEKISTDMEIWDDVVNNTSPGNYGCDFWESKIDYEDIDVDIPNREFTVESGNFSADLVMGASKGDHSFNENYSKPFSAKGKFDFKNAKEITITDISIDIDSDIYGK